MPLTFRAAGTSLSGQAVGSGVIVDISEHWRTLEVLRAAHAFAWGPGSSAGSSTPTSPATALAGARPGVDRRVHDRRHHREQLVGHVLRHRAQRLPHPGVAALRPPSGTEVDTAASGAESALAAAEPAIAAGLMELKARVEGDPSLVARIRRKYRIKNTMGYALNAFLDFDTPLSILWHLLVGSEGTLGFIAEAVFRTVPDLPLKSAGLLLFPSVPAACEAIEPSRRRAPRRSS